MSSRPSICISGVAGFIGFHTAKRFLREGYQVIGIDNLNAYYEPRLKASRLELLTSTRFRFHKMDICESQELRVLLEDVGQVKTFLHLAAQPGVRYALTHPFTYAESNLLGFLSVLEACAKAKVSHLMYASSSSVYGANQELLFSETQSVDHPVSLYAATKKSNELMAHTYAALYQMPCTGLRFFTVYGPYGRPDMALFKFTKAILDDKSIDLYNKGKMSRDFTYVDDVVEAVYKLHCLEPPRLSSSSSPSSSTVAPYRVYNIGSQKQTEITQFVEMLEDVLGRKAKRKLLDMQKGDIVSTCADTSALRKATGFVPRTPLRKGVENFVKWYCGYYRIPHPATA